MTPGVSLCRHVSSAPYEEAIAIAGVVLIIEGFRRKFIGVHGPDEATHSPRR